jgi:hypothetical protein
MKKIAVGFCLIMAACNTEAVLYEFQDAFVEVDAWAGTGGQETLLVVDWNRLDLGTAALSPSHAFGYRWEGTESILDMLNAFHNAGVFVFQSGYGGAFPNNITYSDPDGEQHSHIEDGSWMLAGTDNPFARWGTWGDSEWVWNQKGINEEQIRDGWFVGMNAIMFYGEVPPGADLTFQLDIPMIPEPASLFLLGLGGVCVYRKNLRRIHRVRQ